MATAAVISEPLITKYRPRAFEDVLGNIPVVTALKREIEGASRPHSFLLTGPSGLGKTTLARIIASFVNAEVIEIDAASKSGVDDMRQLVELSAFKPLLAPCRMIIIDECHAISKQGWQPLLKMIEEPPPWLYVALATTESGKVPDTIKTRCFPVALKLLKPQEIEELLEVIASLEGWTVSDNTFQAIVQAALGSPRRALSILQAGHAAVNREELGQIIASVEIDDSPVTEICRLLMQGVSDWRRYSTLLQKIDDGDEAVSIATRYIHTVLLRSEDVQAREAWLFLEQLTMPRNTFDRQILLAQAVGERLWGRQVF